MNNETKSSNRQEMINGALPKAIELVMYRIKHKQFYFGEDTLLEKLLLDLRDVAPIMAKLRKMGVIDGNSIKISYDGAKKILTDLLRNQEAELSTEENELLQKATKWVYNNTRRHFAPAKSMSFPLCYNVSFEDMCAELKLDSTSDITKKIWEKLNQRRVIDFMGFNYLDFARVVITDDISNKIQEYSYEYKHHYKKLAQQLFEISEREIKDSYENYIFNRLLSLKQRINVIEIGNSGTLIYDEVPFYISDREFKEAAECNLYLKPEDVNRKLKKYTDRQKANTLRDRLFQKLKEELTYKTEVGKPDIEKYHDIKYIIDNCDKINAPIDYTVIYTILCASVDEFNRSKLRKEDLLKDYLLSIYKAKIEADLSEEKDISDANMLEEAKNNKSHLSIIYDINELFNLKKGIFFSKRRILSAEERIEISRLANFAQRHEIAATVGNYKEHRNSWILRARDILPQNIEIEHTPDCTSFRTYLKSIGHIEHVAKEYERLKEEASRFSGSPLSYIRIKTAPLRKVGDPLARDIYDLARSQARQEARIETTHKNDQSEFDPR